MTTFFKSPAERARGNPKHDQKARRRRPTEVKLDTLNLQQQRKWAYCKVYAHINKARGQRVLTPVIKGNPPSGRRRPDIERKYGHFFTITSRRF